MSLERVLNYFIPTTVRRGAPDALMRARYVAGLGVWSCVAFFVYALRQIYAHHVVAPGLALIGAAALTIVILFAMRAGWAPAKALHAVCAVVCVSVGAVSYLRGGLVISVAMWALFLPLTMATLRDRPGMYIWGALVLLEFGVLRGLAALGYPGTPVVETSGFIGLVGLLLLVVLLAHIFDESVRQLEDDNAVLERRVNAQQRLEALGRLAGGIAHDFNNLLTVTRAHASIALDELGPTHPQADDLVTIAEAAERGAVLTRQLLALGHQDLVNPRVFDANEAVMSVERLLRRVMPENVAIATRLNAGPWHIRMDRSQLEQVLMNLAVNARDAMPHGGTLEFESEVVMLTRLEDRRFEPGRYVRLRVRDDGVGMSAEVMNRVFEPFFSTKGRDQGSGLGLASAYAIVQRYGGMIEVESESGKGTRFDILLPARSPEEAAPVSRRPPPERANSPGYGTVLIAEDEPAVRAALKRILRRHGYQVLVARDGVEAEQLAESHGGTIDLLVTDVVMPRMSGSELSRVVRALHPESRVLFVSGYADDEEIVQLVARGEARLLAKPYDNHQLLAEVERALLDGGPPPEISSVRATG